jgi:hypothetical protein
MPKWGLRSTKRHISNTVNVVVHDERGKINVMSRRKRKEIGVTKRQKGGISSMRRHKRKRES